MKKFILCLTLGLFFANSITFAQHSNSHEGSYTYNKSTKTGSSYGQYRGTDGYDNDHCDRIKIKEFEPKGLFRTKKVEVEGSAEGRATEHHQWQGDVLYVYINYEHPRWFQRKERSFRFYIPIDKEHARGHHDVVILDEHNHCQLAKYAVE